MPIASSPEARPASALPASGDLSKTSAFQLYFLAASSDESGLLTFRLPDRQIEVSIRKGTPERIDSSHPEDSLAKFVVAQKLVEPGKLDHAQRSLDAFDGDLLTALFGLGLLDPGSAFERLAQQASDLLFKALTAQSGGFAFEPQQLPPHRAMSIGTRWGLLAEVVRRMNASDLQQRLRTIKDQPFKRTLGTQFTADLRLTAQEMRVLGRIDGGRSLNQLVHAFPHDSEALYRLAFLLQQLHAISFSSPSRIVEPKTAPKPAAPPENTPAMTKVRSETRPSAPVLRPKSGPTPVPQAPAAAQVPAPEVDASRPTPQLEGELGELRARVAKLKEQNHFETLGLTEKADGPAIKSAYFHLAKVFHPDTLPQNAPAEMGKLKAQIFAVIGEAYRKLIDDTGRANYLESLKSGGAEQVDVATILRAEDLFQKACILVKGRRYSDALKLLEEAIHDNPDEGEFYAWRGYAKFLAIDDQTAGFREAQEDLLFAVKKNPRSAPAHFLSGEVSRMRGDKAGALKHYQRALQLRPDYIEPQRQIRFLSSK